MRKFGKRGRTVRGKRPANISLSKLPARSQHARDRALHVLSAMRRDPNLTPSRAAKLEGLSYRTLKKYLGAQLRKRGTRYYVTQSDHRIAYLSLPDEQGNIVERKTKSSKERKKAGAFLADFNRYQRGKIASLAKWRNVKIGGIGLLTEPVLVKASEPQMSDYSLYRAFSSGAA